MKFSGHSSERNFIKYLKLDAELKEMADMEMWRAGAAVRSLRPENS